jgi:hypothetical protein
MGLARDSLAKDKSSQCPWTYRTLDKGVGIDAIIIDFPKASHLIPHNRLLTKLEASCVGSTVFNWVREFLVGRTQSVRITEQQSKEVQVTSDVLQGSVSGPVLFVVYVNVFG